MAAQSAVECVVFMSGISLSLVLSNTDFITAKYRHDIDTDFIIAKLRHDIDRRLVKLKH